MFADADHEVIDSAAALFRHLYEEHGVEEARDLDPETAPVQFWLRRHAELERAQRTGRHQDEPPLPPGPPPRPEGRPRPEARTGSEVRPRSEARPGPGTAPRPRPESGPAEPDGRRSEAGVAGREGRRPAGFGDPLVEAMARALAGRGHDEGAVRAAIRSFAAEGVPTGEPAVRARFVEPMLRSAAEQLLGAPAPPRSTGGSQPGAATAPARPTPDPGPPASAPDPPPRRGEDVRPEAAWAVLWADLGETRRRGGEDPGSGGGDGDDLMAVANAVQQRRRVRLLRR